MKQVSKALGAKALPVNAWWTMASTALSDLEHASQFGVTTLIVEDDTQWDWSVVIDALSLYEFSEEFRREGEHQKRVEELRELYRSITESARKRGIVCYVMSSEVFLLDGFETLRSYDKPQLWTFIYERLCEVFRAHPCMDGFALYVDSARPSVLRLPGSEPSKSARYVKLIETVWTACQAERRKLLVSSYVGSPEDLEALTEALRRIPPHEDFGVLQYCCPYDWGLYQYVNPSIGQVGAHPEVIGFDYAAENWGQGAHPFIQVHYMSERLQAARDSGANLAGLAGYVSWYGRTTIGTLNEVNIWAASSLQQNSQRNADDLLNTWCAGRFGIAAAPTAARCMKRTFDFAFKTQYVLSFGPETNEKSGLPSLAELHEFFLADSWGNATHNWDTSRLPVWDKIQVPDVAFLDQVRTEKDEAVELCQTSLAELRANRNSFTEEGFGCLERALHFQELWAGMWKAFLEAFFLYRMDVIRGCQEDSSQLDSALERLAQVSNDMEDAFGPAIFPNGPERARQFIRDLMELKRA